ncbi:hypothetical protein BH11ACT8_BH11ACT8_12280 [soil metagenome]
MTRREVVAVELRCKSGHLIATVHPYPALGAATHLEVRPRPARYRAGLAEYVTGEQSSSRGWVTTAAREPRRFTIQEFDERLDEWAGVGAWACRCGVNTLPSGALVEAAWSWSAQRARGHGNTPRPVVMRLDRSTSMP